MEDANPLPCSTISTSPATPKRCHLSRLNASLLLLFATSLLFYGTCNTSLGATSACATSFPTHGASLSISPSRFRVCFLVLMLKFSPLLRCWLAVVLDLCIVATLGFLFTLLIIFEGRLRDVFFFLSDAKVCCFRFSFWVWIVTNFGIWFTLAMLVFERSFFLVLLYRLPARLP